MIGLHRSRKGSAAVPPHAPTGQTLVDAAQSEAVVNPARALAIISAVLFGGAALSVLHSGRRLRGWAFQKTLEICYWIPEIDAVVQQKERARRAQ